MVAKLKGRGELLRLEIESLEREQKTLIDAIPGIEVTPNQRLEYLRNQLNLELSAKRLVILATSHNIQDNGHHLNSEFEQRLAFLIRMFAPTLLVEEWAEDRPPSFASVLAKRLGLEYTNIGTPKEEQFRTFCNAPINYPGHDGSLGRCSGAPQFYEYGPLDTQENRELRMMHNIENEMKNHAVSLLVLGLAHLHSMSSKIRQANFNVAAYSWIP
jgi:hypothetical protein